MVQAYGTPETNWGLVKFRRFGYKLCLKTNDGNLSHQESSSGKKHMFFSLMGNLSPTEQETLHSPKVTWTNWP